MLLNDKEAKKLRGDTSVVVASVNDMGLRLAQLLYETRNGMVKVAREPEPVPVFETWGFESWQAYVFKELKMSLSNAADYVRVWEVFGVQLKGKWDKKNLTTVSKLRIIANYATERNVNALLRRSAGLSEEELRNAIDPRYQGSVVGMTSHVNLLLDQKKAREVRGFISAAKESAPGLNQAAVLYEMIMFAQEHEDLFYKERLKKHKQVIKEAS